MLHGYVLVDVGVINRRLVVVLLRREECTPVPPSGVKLGRPVVFRLLEGDGGRLHIAGKGLIVFALKRYQLKIENILKLLFKSVLKSC